MPWCLQLRKNLHKINSERCGNYMEQTQAVIKKIQPSKNFKNNIIHHFNWSDICNTPVKKFTRKMLGGCFIVLLKPTLNDQIKSDLLHLFKNGIT